MGICARDLPWVKRQAALAALSGDGRSKLLIDSLRSCFEGRPTIPTGIDRQDLTSANRAYILRLLHSSESDWIDWKWQLANRIENVELLREVLNLDQDDTSLIDRASKNHRWSITPYYLSLMSPDPSCPIRVQSIPSGDDAGYILDSKPRKKRGNVSAVIRVSSQCAMRCQYCQFCRRHRDIDTIDQESISSHLERAIEVIRKRTESRDVLITGGDPLLLDDGLLEWLLVEMDSIPHVEIIRIETRVPATLPQRITAELVRILSEHRPLFINSVFNSPLEITAESRDACLRLLDGGIQIENRAVRLAGVNDNSHVMKRLNEALIQIGIRPYRTGPKTDRK